MFYLEIMNDTTIDNNSLLEEIRDLLIPISAIARAQLVEEGPDRLRAIVGSGQRQGAAQMMDGAHTRSEIQRLTGINAPNLSTLVKELREAGLLTERASKPRLIVGPSGVWKRTKGKE